MVELLTGNWEKIIILKEKPSKTIAECKEEDNVNVWNKNYIKIAEDLSAGRASKKN